MALMTSMDAFGGDGHDIDGNDELNVLEDFDELDQDSCSDDDGAGGNIRMNDDHDPNAYLNR